VNAHLILRGQAIGTGGGGAMMLVRWVLEIGFSLSKFLAMLAE
jgi:hypothetical protein